MIKLSSLTTTQLNNIIAIKEQIEALQSQLDSIADGGEVPTPFAGETIAPEAEAPAPAKRKYHMTASHRRKLVKALAKARKARLAKIKAGNATDSEPARKKDRRSSPAVRAKLAAAAKARWAKARAEGKTTL
jgi:hypothetical protein